MSFSNSLMSPSIPRSRASILSSIMRSWCAAWRVRSRVVGVGPSSIVVTFGSSLGGSRRSMIRGGWVVDGSGAANRARWVAYRWPLRSYTWENTPVSHRHRNRNRGSATYPALLAAFVGTVGASFAHEVGVGSRSAAAIAALQVGRVDGRSRTLPGRLSSGQTHLSGNQSFFWFL
jgi:hypothetical protein